MAGRPEPNGFELLRGSPGAATVFRCALCGARFTHGLEVCASCPLRAGCDVVRCPSCGYTFPRSSRILAWIRRLLAPGSPEGR